MVHGEPRRRRDHAGSDIKAGEILQGSRFGALLEKLDVSGAEILAGKTNCRSCESSASGT
jgi:hypothetical protein